MALSSIASASSFFSLAFSSVTIFGGSSGAQVTGSIRMDMTCSDYNLADKLEPRNPNSLPDDSRKSCT
jgi:hypothetical protein